MSTDTVGSDPLCRSVALWIWIRRVLEAALPSLAERCGIGLAGFHQDDPVDPPDRAGLILTDRDGIGEDISVVFVLLCFTRDLIGRRDQRTAQELCLATQTDQMLYQVVAFCVNFTGLVYEGERQDPNDREVLGSVAVKSWLLPPWMALGPRLTDFTYS